MLATDRIRDIRLLRELMLEEHKALTNVYRQRLLCVFTLAQGANEDDVTHHKQNLIPHLGSFAVCSLYPVHRQQRVLKHRPHLRVNVPSEANYPEYIRIARGIPRSLGDTGVGITLYLYGTTQHYPVKAIMLFMAWDQARIYYVKRFKQTGVISDPTHLHTVRWRE